MKFIKVLLISLILFAATNSIYAQNNQTFDGDTYPNNHFRRWEIADSLNAIKVLAFALDYANKHAEKDSFIYNSTKLLSDSGELSMDYGHLFSADYKHLIIRIPSLIDTESVLNSTVIVLVYLWDNKQFILLQGDTCEFHSYTGDTILDINGDGYKDYIITTYSMNGCCPRDDEKLYLYNYKCGTFYEPIEMLNPSFYPKDKMVFQMDYGWPGSISLYKCQWLGTNLDTIESIQADTAHKNVFIIENNHTSKNTTVKGLPKEYYKYGGIEYFLSAWDK